MKQSTFDILAGILMILVMLGVAFGISLFQASIEAKTFNRCTGANVTAWEALFSNFRIESCK